MQSRNVNITRRHLLRRGLLGGGAIALGGTSVWANESPMANILDKTTALQVAGPFYPLIKPLDQDADLTRVKGRAGRAAGQVIEIAGRVLNADGDPVAGARMEIWQANAHGRYAHQSDPNTAAPLDPNFQGYALLETDELGRYRFKTVKPAAYPVPKFVNSAGMRPPHIHFEISGKRDRLTTQLYFPGEPLNDTDDLLRSAWEQRASVIGKAVPPTADMEDDAHLLLWDVVLATG